MATKKSTLILGLLAFTMLTSFNGPDFPSLPKIKKVTEWKEWAGNIKYKKPKWLQSIREYYENGELKGMLYLQANGDTTALQIYNLNKDSLLKNVIWYNKFLKKWMHGDTYYYKKGEKLPYMTEDNDKYKCYYIYNNQGQIMGERLVNNKNKNFAEYEYTYDTTGLMIKQVEYNFFDEQRNKKRVYVCEYEKNEKRQVIKKEIYFVPHHTEESITMTDKQGDQKTSYYGFTAKAKTITATIYYNEKGERTQKIEYDRNNKPQFIWTYEYEYYQ